MGSEMCIRDRGVSIGTSVFGPIFYGWIFDVTDSYLYAMVTSGLIVALVLPFVLTLPKDSVILGNSSD